MQHAGYQLGSRWQGYSVIWTEWAFDWSFSLVIEHSRTSFNQYKSLLKWKGSYLQPHTCNIKLMWVHIWTGGGRGEGEEVSHSMQGRYINRKWPGGVGALGGQRHIPSKLWPKYPPRGHYKMLSGVGDSEAASSILIKLLQRSMNLSAEASRSVIYSVQKSLCYKYCRELIKETNFILLYFSGVFARP